ncbi:hypothetical protein [Arthrobacter sp. D1-17]
MPWWSWFLIWIALIALSLLFYLLLGIRLFRKFMVTVRELSAAGEKLGHLPEAGPVPGAPGSPDDPGDDTPGMPHLVPGPAVFASPRRVRHAYHASKAFRVEARRQRRIRRKAERGQPQRLRDIELG